MSEQFLFGLLIGVLIGDELMRGSRYLARWIRARNAKSVRLDGTRSLFADSDALRRRR